MMQMVIFFYLDDFIIAGKNVDIPLAWEELLTNFQMRDMGPM